MEEKDEDRSHVEACKRAEEEEEREEAPTSVKDKVKELEKVLDINHFLNIKFNRQNTPLYKKLLKEREESANKDNEEE